MRYCPGSLSPPYIVPFAHEYTTFLPFRQSLKVGLHFGKGVLLEFRHLVKAIEGNGIELDSRFPCSDSFEVFFIHI